MWRHIFPLCWNRSCQPVSYPVFLLSMAEHSFSEIHLRAKKFSLAPLVFTNAKVTWLKKKQGKKLEVLASRSVLSLLLTSLSWEDMLLWAFSVKKIVRTGKEKCLEVVVKFFSVFVSIVISRDLSERSSVAHAYLANNVWALILLIFKGNVNKRQYPKIYSLEFDEIFQNSYYYRTSINENLKTKVEQRIFVT